MAEALSTRERILEAAIEEIELGGEAGLRIERIVAKAHVSIASIYHCFGNRDGLVQAAQLERYSRSMEARTVDLAAAAEACETSEEFKDLVRTLLTWIVDSSRYAVRFKRISVLGSAFARPELQQGIAVATARPVQDLTAVLARGQERGLMPSTWRPEVLAWHFTGALLGRVEFELVQPDGLLAEYDELFISQLLHAGFGD